jgi:hypothetical protein
VRVVLAAVFCLALAVGSTAAPLASASDRVYKWVDENGIAHYTTDPDSIPSDLRGGRDLREPESAEPDLSAIPGPRTGAPPPTDEEVLSSIPAPLERRDPEELAPPEADQELEAVPPPRALPGPRPTTDPPPAVRAETVAPAPHAGESAGLEGEATPETSTEAAGPAEAIPGQRTESAPPTEEAEPTEGVPGTPTQTAAPTEAVPGARTEATAPTGAVPGAQTDTTAPAEAIPGTRTEASESTESTESTETQKEAAEPTAFPPVVPSTVDTAPPDLDLPEAPATTAEVRELESQIARDREVMKSLISGAGTDGTDIASDPRFREISERLPRLQSELDALREEGAPRRPDDDPRASGTGP